MSFRIDNFVIDRVLRGYLLNSDDELIGYLDQLQDCSIEMSSESVDVNSATGTLIKRFYRSKTASLTATSALLNLNVMGLQLGCSRINADGSTTFEMPMSTLVKKGETVTLKGVKAGTVHVYGMTNSGAATIEYEADTTADATHYAITTGGVLTPPTAEDETQYFVYYVKTVTSGVKYLNSAEQFPQSVKIRLEVTNKDKHLIDRFPYSEMSMELYAA